MSSTPAASFKLSRGVVFSLLPLLTLSFQGSRGLWEPNEGRYGIRTLESKSNFLHGGAEVAVEKGLAEKVGAEVKMSCGDRWRVGEAGDTCECEGEDADGPIPPVTITVMGAEGNISWAME